ncbi:unnamed protein product [Choristocarpus tenellus]
MWLMTPCSCLAFIPGLVGKKQLTLEAEEAVLTVDSCMGCHINTRRPYGELQSVDTVKCLCCVGFSSGITGRDGESFPGWGCNNVLVTEIVDELKARMKIRGDTGQMKLMEQNSKQLTHLHAKVDAVMSHLEIPAVPEPMSMQNR